LTKAIIIRDKYGESDYWPFYEFNRAHCRIQVNLQENQIVFPNSVIVSDIKKAWKAQGMKKYLNNDQVIQKWLEANSFQLENL